MTRTQFADARRNIRKQIIPWISIVVIGMVALIAYLSLVYASVAIRQDVSAYLGRYGLWDLEITSTLMLDEEDLAAIRQTPGVERAEPVWQAGALLPGEGEKVSCAVLSLPQEISRPELLEGRLPETTGECAVEAQLQKTLGLAVGQELEVETEPAGGVDPLKEKTYTITGFFRHPDHISFEVPETPYLLVTKECFDLDGLGGAFMKTRIRIADAPEDRYSEAYRRAVSPVREALLALEAERAEAREEKLRAEMEAQLQEGREKLDEATEKLKDAEDQLADGRAQLDEGRAELEKAEKQLAEVKEKLDSGAQALGEAEYMLAGIPPVLAAAAEALGDTALPGAAGGTLSQYQYGKQQYSLGRMTWYAAGEEYLDGMTLLENNRKKLEQGEEEYARGLEEYEKGRAEYEDGVRQLAEAREQLDRIGPCRWLVLNNSGNAGYVFAESQADGLGSMCYSFSIMFLAIAALVIYATVGRMVQEQRALVGTSKALGLYNREILAKYMFYGVSAALMAALLGVGVTYYPVQKALLGPYGAFFTFGTISRCFLPRETAAVVLALPLIAAASVWFACSGLLRIPAIRLLQGEDPSQKRKKARRSPRRGLYTRLIFRNVLTDLRRVLVTTVSIAGCCMLLVGGFTFKYAIERVNPRQFGQVIRFQAEVYFDPEVPGVAEELARVLGEKKLPHVLVRKAGLVLKTGESLSSATAIVAEAGSLDGFYGLQDAADGRDIQPTDEGILIPNRMSTYLDLKPGDSVSAYDASLEVLEIPISGVFTNHFGNLLFFTPACYQSVFGAEAAMNCFLVRLDAMSPDELEAELDSVGAVTSVRDTAADRARFDSFSSILTVVVLILLGLAGVMAYFIVMNLSVTYIQRKTRELTIMRINGFTARECVTYVSWDLVITTLCGTLLGLVAGHFAGQRVLPVSEGPYMQFVHDPDFRTYLFSALITMGFSALVSSAALRRVGKLKLSDMN